MWKKHMKIIVKKGNEKSHDNKLKILFFWITYK